jgi:hypothetical protein
VSLFRHACKLGLEGISKRKDSPYRRGGRRRRLKSYVAVAAISLSSPARNARSHGSREFLVHPLELLGRIGADMIARLREVAPKL